MASAQPSSRAPAARPALSSAAASFASVAPPSASAQPSSLAVASSPALSEAGPSQELTWRFDDAQLGPIHVVVTIPAHAAGERLPLLIALHGLGEALKGPAKGARGWIDDYWLPRALRRLRKPPLKKRDFLGISSPERLATFERELKRRPYGGLVIATAYTPPVFRGERLWQDATPYAAFIVERLLPRLRAETPAFADVNATGIDGVSLGGRAAIAVGLLRPEAFGLIGGLQPAFDVTELDDLASRAAQARQRHPALRFRLLTSSGDYYNRSTRALSDAFRARGVPHELRVIPGPHNYDFNRGPGVYELLLTHDRGLRGEPLP